MHLQNVAEIEAGEHYVFWCLHLLTHIFIADVFPDTATISSTDCCHVNSVECLCCICALFP